MQPKQKKIIVKTSVTALSLVMSSAMLAGVSEARVDVNVNVGVPAVAVPAPVVAVPAVPVPEPPQVVLEAPPRFIMSPELGFYVSVGVPYDIVYIGNAYYLNREGRWFRSPYYNGPWKDVGRKGLPPGLRKHRFEEIRRYRDAEYRKFEHDRGNFHGRWHAPEKHDNGRHLGHDKGGPGERGNGRHGGHDKGGPGDHDNGRHGGHGEGRGPGH